MKIMGTPEMMDLDIKRFYIPGCKIVDICPKCGVEVVRDLGDDPAIYYPKIDDWNEENMYCDECEHEWDFKIKIGINLEIRLE